MNTTPPNRTPSPGQSTRRSTLRSTSRSTRPPRALDRGCNRPRPSLARRAAPGQALELLPSGTLDLGPSGLATVLSRLLIASLLLGLSTGAWAQSGFGRVQKAMVEAYPDRTAYMPGETARLLARVIVDEGWHIQANVPTYDYLIPTEITVRSQSPDLVVVSLSESPPSDQFVAMGTARYPPPLRWRAPFAGDEILDVYEGEVLIEVPLQIPANVTLTEAHLEVELSYQACDDRVCLAPTTAFAPVLLVLGAAGEPQYGDLFEKASLQNDQGASEEGAGSGAKGRNDGSLPPRLAAMLLFGFVGGLLLNLMPCVLPVLSIKIFGLLHSAEGGHARVRRGALAFAAGILVSFWGLAAAAIALRATGEAIGWGIQFQNPIFVAFLTLVMVFFSLNLWGQFEIPMPAFLVSAGGSSSEGVAGHFSAGLLATLMATPCSAPFLGTAVGFALARPPALILAIFTAVGLGLAAPNLLLAVSPRAASLLPRPGQWMETLKGVFGFLLAGTAVWLLYVLNSQIASESLAFLEAALLLVGLFAFLHHRWLRSGTARRGLATVGMMTTAFLVLWIAAVAPPAGVAQPEISDYQWRVFDEAEAESLAASGQLVFVDVTADWCATCKVNERVVLGNRAVREAIAKNDVVMMRADWTNRDETIARYLADFGRYAIPFYVLYRPGQEPHVFGELLNRSTLVQTLEQSSGRIAAR